MKRIISIAAMTLSFGIALPVTATAQTAADLVGTWTNVSNVNIRQDGSKVDLFGPHGTGMAIFASNGRYMVINANPDVPKFASNINPLLDPIHCATQRYAGSQPGGAKYPKSRLTSST